MVTVLPSISTGKAVRIPWGLKICPSNAFNTVGEEMRVGETRAYQNDKDIMQVAAPSSKTVRQMFLPRHPMVNMKVTDGGRWGSQLFESNEIRLVSEGSTPPIVVNKAFRCIGKLCKTSKENMA